MIYFVLLLLYYFSQWISKHDNLLQWIELKDWRTWRKKYSMSDDYMLNKVLDEIKKITAI